MGADGSNYDGLKELERHHRRTRSCAVSKRSLVSVVRLAAAPVANSVLENSRKSAVVRDGAPDCNLFPDNLAGEMGLLFHAALRIRRTRNSKRIAQPDRRIRQFRHRALSHCSSMGSDLFS